MSKLYNKKQILKYILFLFKIDRNKLVRINRVLDLNANILLKKSILSLCNIDNNKHINYVFNIEKLPEYNDIWVEVLKRYEKKYICTVSGIAYE